MINVINIESSNFSLEKHEMFMGNISNVLKLQNPLEAKIIIEYYNGNNLCGFVYLYFHPNFENTVLIGNYCCVNNLEYATAIFNAIEKIADENNINKILGPIHGNTWHSYRYSNKNEDSFFLEYENCNYFLDQWKANGFEIDELYQSNIAKFDKNIVFDTPKLLNDLKDRNLELRNIDLDHFAQDLNKIYHFCMDVFKDNVYFSPISEPDFLKMYRSILPILDPKYIYLVFDNQQLVSMLFAIPDIYKKDRIIIKTIARNKNPKYNGLARIMSELFYNDANQHGFDDMIHAYFHVDNKSKNVSTEYFGEKYKEHYLLSKNIK